MINWGRIDGHGQPKSIRVTRKSWLSEIAASEIRAMRKRFSAKQKSQIVLEILREEKTIAQIASEYSVHPTQLHRWKKQALDHFSEVGKSRPWIIFLNCSRRTISRSEPNRLPMSASSRNCMQRSAG